MYAPVKSGIPSLQMDEGELINALLSSVYSGAQLESVKLVISYCRAQQLDPLQKPVHIVPMDVNTGKKDHDGYYVYEKRDVIMPGIGLYRVQASRTGEYAGMGEPEFGPMESLTFADKNKKMVEFAYPQWCKITVHRVVHGQVCAWTVREFWLENYAIAGRGTTAPNAMWRKRKFGQLAKCTEAQALRKAFPELGAAPTYEEMQGKTITVDDADDIEGVPQIPPGVGGESVTITMPTSKNVSRPETVDHDTGEVVRTASPRAQSAPDDAPKPAQDKPMSDGQKRILRARMKSAGVTDAAVAEHFKRGLDEMAFAQFAAVQEWVMSQAVTEKA